MEEIKKTGPKDVFLHIFTIIALYVSVISLLGLIFQLINIYLPDPLEYGTGYFSTRTIRWPLAVSTVMFPLYLLANSFLQKEIVKFPEKRELKTRKWLIYLTLFITVLVIAGDLISLIFRYLEGELTLRFFLKVMVVLFTAALVFLYYGWNVKKEIPASKNKTMNIFVKSAVFLTFAFIVFGYFVAGSPQAERLRRFDEKRIVDLQQIQFQIVEFWRAKKKLPSSLEELRNEILGFIPPKDPETGESYEYRIISELSFELCANFKTSNVKESGRIAVPTFPDNLRRDLWLHDIGRVCFERKIDSEFYPPYQKEIPPKI
jgi:hypothetical protein